MMNAIHYLIIGNGAAGVSAAETIRQLDAHGRITIVSGERTPMYSRPGLAYVLLQEMSLSQIVARTEDWYGQMGIHLEYGLAQQLDVQRKTVTLDNGLILPYDRLLIATGARAVPPPYPGANLDGVVYLDNMDGTKQLLRKMRRAKRAVVIGGGITALELVEGLAHHGIETHYLVRRDRLWHKVFNNVEAALLAEKMSQHRVHIHYRSSVAEIVTDRRQRVRGVLLENGSELPCDLLGVAIGVRPQLQLVQGTPLRVERGIWVDENMETNVAGIFAAGNCAQAFDRWSGQHLVDSLWPSAVSQGQAAGQNMVSRGRPYQKGAPFNVCMLFGMHVTAIGQINPNPEEAGQMEAVQHLSRGSSEVWFTFPRHYHSAWSEKGLNTMRLLLDDKRLVGALIIGEQKVADSLRFLIDQESDISELLPYLHRDREILQQQILALGRKEQGG